MLKKIFLLLLSSVSLRSVCMDWSLENLPLKQKIGQLFMVAAVADEEIAQESIAKKSYRMDKDYIENLIIEDLIGGVIYLSRSDKQKQIERTKQFQTLSTIPLLIGQDLEPGVVGASRLPECCVFSSNKALGQCNNTNNTYLVGFEIGELCKQLGVHINFAPVADVLTNTKLSTTRSFGDDPSLVETHAVAFHDGLQDAGIIACAKHFPGHGAATGDSHTILPTVDRSRKDLFAIDIYPFKQLIVNKIPAIMIGHLLVPALDTENPATLSKIIVTDILQKKLGFKGLIITDALDMKAITENYSAGEAAVRALQAGNDLLLCSPDVSSAVLAIEQAVHDGFLTEEEINMHVAKILHVKQKIFS